ncbi:MAG TPA: hypothetical protein VH590_09000 [Ktedonobacterales bacterium]|jgi:hypothetical protein
MADESDDPAFPPLGLGNNLPLVELETRLNRKPSRHKRLTQSGLLLAAALVALCIFWGSIAPGRQTTFRSTPVTLTLVLLIDGNVNYGTVTVNGVQEQGQMPLLFGLPAGPSYALDITLNAPPFLPQACRVHLFTNGLADSDNHCHAALDERTDAMTINGKPVLPSFDIDFSLTLNDLPPEQQSKVIATLNQALTYQQDLTAPVGSYFAAGVNASGKISSRRASAPLRASAIVAPFVPQQDQSSEGCSGFLCSAGLETQTASALSGDLWNITATVAARWRFRGASGAVVSDVQFPQANTIMLLLEYDQAGGWSVSSIVPPAGLGPVGDQLTSTFCATGQNILARLVKTSSVGGGPEYDRGAIGCELMLYVNDIDQGLYLWRFGALLAADARAHAAHPELPVAPPAEIGAVEQP